MLQETLPPAGDIMGTEAFPTRAGPTCTQTSLREVKCSVLTDASRPAAGARALRARTLCREEATENERSHSLGTRDVPALF